MAASDSCEKAIRDLVSSGGFIDLFVDVANKGFAGGVAELFKAFFDLLFGPFAAVARPLFAALLEKLGGRGAVNSFTQKLLEFAQKAKAAAQPQCLNQYDEVWNEVADMAGIKDAKTLKEIVERLSGKSEEEICRRVEELARDLERIEGQIHAISISPDYTYFYAGDWLGGKDEDGRLKLCNVFMGDCGRDIYVEYVSNELEKKVVEKVRKRAEEGGGLLIVKGAKGIGKSTAVQVALYRVLQLLQKMDGQYYKPVLVAVEKYSKDEAEKFIHVAKELGFYPIFYLDPSKPRAYPKEPTGLYQPEVSIGELRLVLDKLRDVTGAVAVIVLSNDQYQAVEDLVGNAVVIDADQLLASEKEKYVETLVKNYSGCPGEVVKRVAKAVALFNDNYAVAAVLAADWLKKDECRGEEVKRAVEKARGNIYRFALDYIWHMVLGGDEVVAKWAAPLVVAAGFFGPHPPKLAETIVRAFGGVLVNAVVKWFSQPLHDTLYEAVRGVAHGAVYRRFGVGGDELCQGSVEGPCRLVELCSEVLVGIPRKRYDKAEEVAEEYVKLVAKALKAPGPAGVRQIDFLVDDFLRVYNGIAEDRRWRISYEIKGSDDVKTVEDIVDELDVLSALYGLAVLPVWDTRLRPLEDWLFVSGKKARMVSLYFYPLLKERSGELVKRAVAIVNEVMRRGYYADVNLWRTVGVAAAGQWDNADSEELEKAVQLAAFALHRLATASPTVLDHIEPLLSEAWRRVVSGETHGDGERRQRLADWLTVVVYNIAIGHPPSLLHFFTIGLDKPSQAILATRFSALYNAASNVGKLQLLDALLYLLGRHNYVNIVADLLSCRPKDAPVCQLKDALEEMDRRIKWLVFDLHGVERAYVVARLCPRLARRYASIGRTGRATKFVEKSLKALEELWDAYEKDKASLEEVLRPYLEVKHIKPDLEMELNELRRYVYSQVAHTYMVAGKLDDAVRYAEMACKFAKELGDVYDKVSSCWLPPRLKAVRDGVPPVKDFEEVWQKASQIAGRLGAETIAATLGYYVVALICEGRLGEVEKVLEEWGWALELDPRTSALTYGVLSLFDDRHLEKAMESLPKEVRFNLPHLANRIHSTLRGAYRLAKSHGTIIEELMQRPGGLFLPALVGLAYCEKGVEWGLELAREMAWEGSRRSPLGTTRRLFGELAEALKMAVVGNCVTEGVLKAVYKLYYFHV